MDSYYFRAWREHAGLSQGQLAKLTKVTKTTVSRIERGQRTCTLTFLEDFCRAVGYEGKAIPIAWPLTMHPNATPIPHARKVSKKELDERFFETHRELEKRLRKQEDAHH